jgi:hypothetical protein
MASKRRLRRRACVGKIRHLTLKDANYHAFLLRQKTGEHVVAYKCAFCESRFHVGHKKKDK